MTSTLVVWDYDLRLLASYGLILLGATMLIALLSWHLVNSSGDTLCKSRLTLGTVISLSLLGIGLILASETWALVAGVFSLAFSLFVVVRKYWQKQNTSISLHFAPHDLSPYRPMILLAVILLALLAVPGLLFPTQRPLLTLLSAALVLALWLILWLWPTGAPWSASKQDFALILALVGVAVAAILGDGNELTLSKIAGILLGIAAYSVALLFRSEKQLKLLVIFYLVAGTLFSIVGLFFIIEPHKYSLTATIYDVLPRVIDKLPEAMQGQANPNQLAGTLLFIWPLALALTILPIKGDKIWGLRVLAIISTVLVGATLIFCQSRSGWVGALAGVLAVFMARWRWFRKMMIWILVIFTVLFLIFIPLDIVGEITKELLNGQTFSTPLGNWNLHSRPAVWAQAIELIEKSPWFGNGLGTFREYVTVNMGTYSVVMPHAHNIVLQLVYDFGLFGAAAFLAFFGILLGQSIRLLHQNRGWLSSVGVGVMAAVVGFGVYGIGDTIALGAKTGIFFWMLAGLVQEAFTLGNIKRSR